MHTILLAICLVAWAASAYTAFESTEPRVSNGFVLSFRIASLVSMLIALGCAVWLTASVWNGANANEQFFTVVWLIVIFLTPIAVRLIFD